MTFALRAAPYLSHNFFANQQPLTDKSGGDSSESRSSSTDSDSETPKEKRKKKKFNPKFSVLSQLAPELTQSLQNKTRVTLAGFENICKLFIKDNLNSKSIDRIYSCKPGISTGFDGASENLRNDITRMDQGKVHFNRKVAHSRITSI